jgi:hypothetical protein
MPIFNFSNRFTNAILAIFQKNGFISQKNSLIFFLTAILLACLYPYLSGVSNQSKYCISAGHELSSKVFGSHNFRIAKSDSIILAGLNSLNILSPTAGLWNSQCQSNFLIARTLPSSTLFFSASNRLWPSLNSGFHSRPADTIMIVIFRLENRLGAPLYQPPNQQPRSTSSTKSDSFSDVPRVDIWSCFDQIYFVSPTGTSGNQFVWSLLTAFATTPPGSTILFALSPHPQTAGGVHTTPVQLLNCLSGPPPDNPTHSTPGTYDSPFVDPPTGSLPRSPGRPRRVPSRQTFCPTRKSPWSDTPPSLPSECPPAPTHSALLTDWLQGWLNATPTLPRPWIHREIIQPLPGCNPLLRFQNFCPLHRRGNHERWTGGWWAWWSTFLWMTLLGFAGVGSGAPKQGVRPPVVAAVVYRPSGAPAASGGCRQSRCRGWEYSNRNVCCSCGSWV